MLVVQRKTAEIMEGQHNSKEWTGQSLSSLLCIADDKNRWATITVEASVGVPTTTPGCHGSLLTITVWGPGRARGRGWPPFDRLGLGDSIRSDSRCAVKLPIRNDFHHYNLVLVTFSC